MKALAHRYPALNLIIDERLPVTLFAIQEMDLYLLVKHQHSTQETTKYQPVKGEPRAPIEVGRLSTLPKHHELFDHLRLMKGPPEEVQLPDEVVRGALDQVLAQEKFEGYISLPCFSLQSGDGKKWNMEEFDRK